MCRMNRECLFLISFWLFPDPHAFVLSLWGATRKRVDLETTAGLLSLYLILGTGKDGMTLLSSWSVR